MAWHCKPAIYRKPFRGIFFSCLIIVNDTFSVSLFVMLAIGSASGTYSALGKGCGTETAILCLKIAQGPPKMQRLPQHFGQFPCS